MFGTFLRLERKRLDLESKEVADALGLTETYYRLVESGRAALNQSLAFKLADLIAHRGASTTGDGSQVRFQRLALFLVGAHLVGSEMVGQEAGDADVRAVEALATRDPDFELFHVRTREYYALREGDEKQRYLEESAAPEVGRFLGSLVYSQAIEGAVVEQVLPTRTLLALPTANVEMIVRLTADLTGRPFIHTPDVAAAWEDRTSRLFRGVSGLYESTDLILSSTNLERFHYRYLHDNSFKKLRFLFLEPGNKDVTKRKFLNQLSTARQAANLEPVNREDTRKIVFAHLSTAAAHRYHKRIESIRTLTPGDPQFQAYWSFETTIDLPIGFVGSKGGHADDIWNLSLSASFQKRGEFEKLWGDVVATTR